MTIVQPSQAPREPPGGTAGIASAPAIRAQLFALAVTFGTYVAAGTLGLIWLDSIAGRDQASTSSSLSVVWLAPGFGVACLLRYGRRAWPAILAGSVVVWGVIRNSNMPLAIAEGCGEALSIVLIVTLLRLWGFRPTLDRYKDSLLLIAALGIGRIVSSAIDVLTMMVVVWFTTNPRLASALAAAGVMRRGSELTVSTEALGFAARWWANTVAGCLLVVPLLALRFDTAPLRRGYASELALLAVGIALWIAIGLLLPYAGVWPALLLTAFALVTWAAIRFGVGIAMAATLLLAMTASAGFGSRFGAFAEIAFTHRLEAAWGFIGMLIGTALFLTALIAQRERALRAIAGSVERYRRLFVGNPQPMWVEDAASRRILLANPAALRTYGYAEAEFLALDARNLSVGSDASALTVEPSESTDVAVERHRTRDGSETDVEITRLITTLGGSRVLVCCAELLTERNQLRLTALTAGDIERFRLGEAIEKQLTPPLARIAATAERLARSPQAEPAPAPLLHSLSADASAAVQVCKGLTRGASALQSANGDLSEALRRLPATLPERGPSLQVSIRTSGGLALSVERRDHLYRIAEEAVRSAAVRAGAHSVWVTLEVAPTTVRIVIEDDGETLITNDAGADVALRSIAARAVAAEGQLQIGRSWAGGRIISFECDQQSDGAAADPHSDASAKVPPHGVALDESPAPADHPERSPPRWHIGIALLLVASASAWALDRFLLTVDAEHFWYGSLLPLPYLPFGFAVAALMLGGEWLAGVVFVATLMLSLTAGPDRWALSALDGFCVVISVLVTVRALSLWGFRFSCERFRDILLLGAAAGLGQLLERVIYLIGTLLIWVAKPQILPEISAAASAGPYEVARLVLQGSLTWWIAGTWGILLVVPAVVSWSPAAWNRLREYRSEVFAWAIGVGVASVALFAISGSDLQLPILTGCLALTIWAALRFGVAAAWTSILLIVISATGSFIANHGVLAASGGSEGIGTLWGFVILLGATAQLLTTLLADSDQKERNLRQLDARYRRLFETVPHPLFAVSLGGERIHIANRAARERYGYSEEEFETMSLRDLEIEEPSAPATPMHSVASEITHQHRSKSGEILDVEVARTPVDLDDEPGALCFAINVTERNRLRTQMIEAIDRERRHFAQEFHDGLGQILTGLQLGIEPLLRCAERHERAPIAAVEFLSTAAREALRACERIMRGLSPLQETGGDLLAALAHLPDRLPPDARGQINVSVSAADAVTLPLEFREHLYQIAQEATNNSIKHANATRISITVSVNPGEILLRVEDDGRGFDPARIKGGIGLDSLRLRATALNAQLRIVRRAGRGMIVECRCPQARTASYRSDLINARAS